jgi:adenine-specific DNA-methyltransferase
MTEAPNPIQRRLLAEDLVRLRRPDEQRRYAACQRQGRIDPNPHQIDAVVFALRRIPEGGCILADEVGLGKTIEAGLIISQLMAEGMRRVLLIVPKSLLGQWQTELYTLFGIETKEGRVDPDAFAGPGVFLAHRELAGGVKGASVLKAVDPFDLLVVDEAHEVFSSVYKRFDKEGFYDDDSKHAQTAGRVREVVKRGGSPVLLLTATPIQNSLAELWGLVQYVEPTGTLLGRLPTFREVFCDTGDRSVLPEQAVELKRRLQTVLQRTLRRQAQEFLEVPFVERRARVFEYEMSGAEKALYDDVTAWLMREQLFSFSGSQRHLLLILFHRRMASSLEALAVSLRHVAARLRERLGTRGYLVADDGELVLRELSDDFEGNLEPESKEDGDDADPEPPADQEPPKVSDTAKGVLAELEEVEEFAARASSLTHDSKARRLLDALRIVRERGEQGSGSGKAVIFTEALSTQDYLKRLLIAEGYHAEDVTLFRGSNKSPEAERALARWEAEIGNAIPAAHRPSREIAVRLALVHEFASRSNVFISTEAGAKGLNLQFCDTIINYDLPWNPQRIEQRIGRVHRYGQKRGVTVISFLAAGNEAQRLTLDILTQKLDLFGRVLDASDAILYEPSRAAPESLVASVGVDFERELRSIYSRARSIDDVAADLRHLRSTMEERRQAFDDEQERTSDLVESRLDDAVRQVFAKYRSELPAELDGLDRDVDRIMSAFLDSSGASYERSQQPGWVEYRIQPSGAMPDGYREGFVAVIGDSREISEGEALHVGHPVIQAAIDDARRGTSAPMRVVFGPLNGATGAVSALAGRRGRLVVTKVSYRGIEPADSLLTTAVLDGSSEPLESSVLDLLLALPARETDLPVDTVGATELQDAVDEAVFRDQATVSATEQARFDQMLRQLDHYLSDQVLVWRRKRAKVDDEIEELTKRLSKTLSAQAKADQEGRLRTMTKQAADIGSQIDKLENGGDADYQEWRERLFARRFRSGEVTRLLDVQFEVEAGDRAC